MNTRETSRKKQLDFLGNMNVHEEVYADDVPSCTRGQCEATKNFTVRTGSVKDRTKLFWNSCVGQEQHDGNIVSRVRLVHETEHDWFELWGMRADGSGGKHVRNRYSRSEEQDVWMRKRNDCLVHGKFSSSRPCDWQGSKSTNTTCRHKDLFPASLGRGAWSTHSEGHGDKQQIADCLTRNTTPQAAHREALEDVSRSRAALVCVERGCRISTPTHQVMKNVSSTKHLDQVTSGHLGRANKLLKWKPCCRYERFHLGDDGDSEW